MRKRVGGKTPCPGTVPSRRLWAGRCFTQPVCWKLAWMPAQDLSPRKRTDIIVVIPGGKRTRTSCKMAEKWG